MVLILWGMSGATKTLFLSHCFCQEQVADMHFWSKFTIGQDLWKSLVQPSPEQNQMRLLRAFWDTSEELQRWDVTASLYQGLAIFLEKCILLMFRLNFPWDNGHRLSLAISVCTSHEGLYCLVYNLLLNSGTQQLHPLPALPALSCLLVLIFFYAGSPVICSSLV